MAFERQTTSNNPPINKPSNKTSTYIIAVPKCHDNLFKIIRDNHEWLAESQSFRVHGKEKVFLKKINTQEDLDKLEKIIQSLRTEKSELFIDDSYRPKPNSMSLEDYITEYLKNKSVGTHYTFKSFYRITVFPFGFDPSLVPTSVQEEDDEQDNEQQRRYKELFNQRREYIIVPLYIILKKGKTYDQMKTLSYNEDGSYNVSAVNPHHFLRVGPAETDQEEIDRKNEEMKERVISAY